MVSFIKVFGAVVRDIYITYPKWSDCTGPQILIPTKLPLRSACWDCKNDCKLRRVTLLDFYAKLGSPYTATVSTDVLVKGNAYYLLSYDLTHPYVNALIRQRSESVWNTTIKAVTHSNVSAGQPTEGVVFFEENSGETLEAHRTVSFFVPAGRTAVSVTFNAFVVRLGALMAPSSILECHVSDGKLVYNMFTCFAIRVVRRLYTYVTCRDFSTCNNVHVLTYM
jgi:hypothetical protein